MGGVKTPKAPKAFFWGAKSPPAMPGGLRWHAAGAGNTPLARANEAQVRPHTETGAPQPSSDTAVTTRPALLVLGFLLLRRGAVLAAQGRAHIPPWSTGQQGKGDGEPH